MHKAMLMTIIGLLIIGAVLTIIQMWAPIMDWSVYIKLMITIGIVGVVLGLVMVLKSDLAEHKTMKDENYLD